jgi:putative membrane protein
MQVSAIDGYLFQEISPTGGEAMMHWMFGDYGMGFGSGIEIFMIFFWLLIILAIFMLAKELFCPGRGGKENGGESAEEILKKRYARGEINEEEFRKMRDTLR